MSTNTRIFRTAGWIGGVLIALMGVHAHAETTLSIVTPAGGESWAAGTTVAILWEATDPRDYVDIYLEQGGQWYATIGYVPMADGRLDWEICPSLGDADDYSIRIVGCDAGGDPVEASSATFAITSSLVRPTLNVTYPAVGDVWSAGTLGTITWDSTDPSGHVYVDLLRNGVLYREIGYTAVEAGSFDWLPCTVVGDGDDYSIRLSMDACGPSPEAIGGVFTIADSLPSQMLTVTAPDIGAVWPGGATRQITWTSSDPAGYVRLDLYRDGLWHRYVGYTLVGAGAFDWRIDSRVGDAAEYTIRLASPDTCGGMAEAFSEPFGVRTTDEDRDGDVDLADFGRFAACFNGLNRPPALGADLCAGFDQDADGDVDVDDFRSFLACYNGPNRLPQCL